MPQQHKISRNYTIVTQIPGLEMDYYPGMTKNEAATGDQDEARTNKFHLLLKSPTTPKEPHAISYQSEEEF